MVEDLFSTMSGAGHKDEVTKDFESTREGRRDAGRRDRRDAQRLSAGHH
ncbi:hypothetical protein [Micromonospora sp. NPDC005161]